MCGRFSQSYTWRELVELYRLTQRARNLRPRYNIAPTTTIDVLRSGDASPELVPMRWASFRVGGKDRQGSSLDVQRAARDGRPKADVPLGLQTHPLHHRFPVPPLVAERRAESDQLSCAVRRLRPSEFPP
jgi:SOS response associated peptidase (SRAP)